MKKVSSLFLALVMCLSLAVPTVSAAEDTASGNGANSNTPSSSNNSSDNTGSTSDTSRVERGEPIDDTNSSSSDDRGDRGGSTPNSSSPSSTENTTDPGTNGGSESTAQAQTSLALMTSKVVRVKARQKTQIFVFMGGNLVVEMPEDFFVDYMSASQQSDRSMTSTSGHLSMVTRVMDRLQRDSSVMTIDGTCVYGSDVLTAATSEWQMSLKALINLYTGLEVETEVLGGVGLSVIYNDDPMTLCMSSMTVYRYDYPYQGGRVPADVHEKVEQHVEPTGMIWNVRQIDATTVEVYLRNGTIMTLPMQVVVDYVDGDNRMSIGIGFDDSEMDVAGARLARAYVRTVIEALIAEGWTRYPVDLMSIEGPYELPARPVEETMSPRVRGDVVLNASLEAQRSPEARSDVLLLLSWPDDNGNSESDHCVQLPMSFEFIGPDYATGEMRILPLQDGADFARLFTLAQMMQLSESGLMAIQG